MDCASYYCFFFRRVHSFQPITFQDKYYKGMLHKYINSKQCILFKKRTIKGWGIIGFYKSSSIPKPLLFKKNGMVHHCYFQMGTFIPIHYFSIDVLVFIKVHQFQSSIFKKHKHDKGRHIIGCRVNTYTPKFLVSARKMLNYFTGASFLLFKYKNTVLA